MQILLLSLAIFALCLLYLFWEVSALRRRVDQLESLFVQAPGQAANASPPLKPLKEPELKEWAGEPEEWIEEWESPDEAAAPVVPTPTAERRLGWEQPVLPKEAAAPRHQTLPSDQVSGLFAKLFHWLISGNPVLKAGIVVLFFGVAFLLNYAAQRHLFPIELRLAGVAVGGLALLLLGWRLRRKHTLYGLGLQGAGVGILYLVVFAAAKLYHLLPLPLGLGVMVGLVGLSCMLAILQDARGLAVAGSMGGFLAPVLMASGGGNHVLLFSYYALLNCGILAIAWFKAWRELNLTGFLFTFGIAAFWGASAYTPAHFVSTEPFLILFFVMYCLISVLFAHRQPPRLLGYIDGALVFGLPIVASGIQAYLAVDFRYGLAFSALALGGWYIGLARLLWKRMAEGMHLLTEAFLALGLVFASLAIPFGLDAQWTSAAWALEGAAMVWVGVKQERLPARIFGLLLQIGAGVSFIASPHPISAPLPLFANRYFLGCAMIAAAALFSPYWLEQNRRRGKWESVAAQALVAWGIIWWYVGGIVDLSHHVHGHNFFSCVLLFAVVSTAGCAMLIHWSGWRRLLITLPLPLLFMIVVFCVLFCAPTLMGARGTPLLTGWGWLAWPLAMALQYGLLFRFQDETPPKLLTLWHTLTLWMLLAVVTTEIARRVGHHVDQTPELAATWSVAVWGLVPTVMLLLLAWRGNRLTWPVSRFPQAYRGIGADVPLAVLLLWNLTTLFNDGNPSPLPYLPLCNPLELVELTILLLAGFRAITRPTANITALRLYRCLLAALAFLWLNTVICRSVHFFADILYNFGYLFASPTLQAGIAVMWSALALTLTIWGARQRQRAVWLIGAWLLGLTVCKLFLVDLAGIGAIGRIVSFLAVGILMLLIGFFAPLPPRAKEPSQEPAP